MRALPVALLFLLPPATGAFAQDKPAGDAARAKAEHESLEAFAQANPSCHEWSDGCAVCSRTEGSAFGCSLPGLACQPQALACRSPTPP